MGGIQILNQQKHVLKCGGKKLPAEILSTLFRKMEGSLEEEMPAQDNSRGRLSLLSRQFLTIIWFSSVETVFEVR